MPRRQRDDQIAMNFANALAVTIRPPFGARANAVTARSISPASRTLIGLTSIPNDGATDWMTANWPIPAVYGGIPKDRRSRHARRDLFEQFQPFPAQAVFELHKAGGVAARPRQAIDEAGADRIGDTTNTIGTVRVACSNGPTGALPEARMTSGASATNSAAYLRMWSALPAAQRLSIRTLRPSVQPNCCSPAGTPRGGPALPDRPRPRP